MVGGVGKTLTFERQDCPRIVLPNQRLSPPLFPDLRQRQRTPWRRCPAPGGRASLPAAIFINCRPEIGLTKNKSGIADRQPDSSRGTASVCARRQAYCAI